MGRPRKYDRPYNQTVTFETAELEMIRAEARRSGMSISAYIRGLSLLGMATLWRKRRPAGEAPASDTETVSPSDAAEPGRSTGRRPSRPGR